MFGEDQSIDWWKQRKRAYFACVHPPTFCKRTTTC